MLEILILISLTKKIGEIMERKGHKSGWYKVLTVVLWFGGELMGAIVGAVITELTGVNFLVAYLGA